MPTDSTVAQGRSFGLSQKLRDLGHSKRRAEDSNTQQQGFEIVHTPDRPARVFAPVDAPTEEDCGSAIISWHLAAAKKRLMASARSQDTDPNMVGHHSLRHIRGRLENEQEPRDWHEVHVPDLTRLPLQDDSTAEDSDDDGRSGPHHPATDMASGRDMRRVGNENQQPQSTRVPPLRVQTQAPVPETNYTGQQLQHPRLTDLAHPQGDGATGKSHQVPRAPSTPPGGATAVCPSLPDRTQSTTPAPAAVGRNEPPTRPRPPADGDTLSDKKESRPVDMEQLVRMEKYRRGVCPFCRWFFGDNQRPLECPNPNCRRDLTVCLEYPTRVVAQKAPPRLSDRAFLGTQPQDGDADRGKGIVRRKAVDNLRAQPGPAQQLPARQPKMPGTQPSDTTQKTWPSRFEFCEAIQAGLNSGRDKPLPSPPQPPARSERRAAAGPAAPAMARSGSAPEHQQPFPNQQHAASQMTKTIGSSSLSSSWTPQSSSVLMAAANNNSSSSSSSSSSSKHTATGSPPFAPTSRLRTSPPRGRRDGKSGSRMDDVDVLAWKRPQERKMFERQLQRKGDDADLFLDIIDQYGDSDSGSFRAGRI